jgi:hypothetical protein
MTLHWWLGLSALVVVVGVIVWTFRIGFGIKPDPNNDPTGGLPPGGTTGL